MRPPAPSHPPKINHLHGDPFVLVRLERERDDAVHLPEGLGANLRFQSALQRRPAKVEGLGGRALGIWLESQISDASIPRPNTLVKPVCFGDYP